MEETKVDSPRFIPLKEYLAFRYSLIDLPSIEEGLPVPTKEIKTLRPILKIEFS